VSSTVKEGSGTIIQCNKKGLVNFITAEALSQLIKNKFTECHNFTVYVNDDMVIFPKKQIIKGPEDFKTTYGAIKITRYVTDNSYKGILFYVDDRPIGEPTWDILDEIDQRRNEYKMLVAVEVDFLKSYVLPDWSGFIKGDYLENIMVCIKTTIRSSLSDISELIISEKKTNAIRASLPTIRQMSSSSRGELGEAVDMLLKMNPKMSSKDIDNVVRVIATCSGANSKYGLMEKLAKADSEDIDDLYLVLNNWSIKELRIVYDELNQRIWTIEKLEKLVNDKKTDELHVLQPLFESNLWIFGPEYDSCSFLGNKALSTILREMFDKKNVKYDRRRADIIMLPESSISVRSADKFDSSSEAQGYSKIVILELKKGGFTITETEKNQAKDYAIYIKNSGKVNLDVNIVCYVLGAKIGPGYEENIGSGNTIVVMPLAYDLVLRRAHQRLFNLVEKMKEVNPDVSISGDEVIDEELKKIPSIEESIIEDQKGKEPIVLHQSDKSNDDHD